MRNTVGLGYPKGMFVPRVLEQSRWVVVIGVALCEESPIEMIVSYNNDCVDVGTTERTSTTGTKRTGPESFEVQSSSSVL